MSASRDRAKWLVTLLLAPTINSRSVKGITHDVGCIVVPLGAGINQQVLLSRQGSIVCDVVKGRRSGAAGNNGVVCHVLCALGNAALQKDGLELHLVGRLLRLLDDGLVRQAGDVVGLADHGHLELILDDARDFNGLLEQGKVLVLEADEGDVVRHLAVDGVDGRAGGGIGQVGERRVDLGRQLDLVDVVQPEGVVDGGRQAGPDDVVGVDRGDEERRLGGLDVVGEVAVGEVAAGQVVEVAALAARGSMAQLADSSFQVIAAILHCRASHVPEGLGRVIVLEQLGHAALEIEHAVGVGVLLADQVDDAAGVRLARVLALEHGFEVLGDHGGRVSMRQVGEAAIREARSRR